jgi:hypothetical protein
MTVARGNALAWSAALHTLGIGLAGWATHGRYHEPRPTLELHTTRAYALHYLTLLPPKPPPEPRPTRATTGVRRPAPLPQAAAAPVRLEPPRRPLKVEELPPGEVAGIGQTVARPAAEPPPRAVRGVDRPAALVAAAGSACPELPVPGDRARREVAVTVAFVVDTNGKVDPSELRVIESPGRPPSGRRFYPRIYVVGARVARHPSRVDPAGYDSMVTRAVTSHVAGLTFRPALSDGRPVRSTVLVACQRAPDG